MQRKWFGKLGVLLLALSLITACNMDNNGDMNEGPLNQQEDQDGNQNNNGDQNQQDGEDNLKEITGMLSPMPAVPISILSFGGRGCSMCASIPLPRNRFPNR